MKKTYGNTIILLGALLAFATDTHAEAWSLDSCINYALEHNLSVKTRDNDIVSARLSVTEAKSQFLPTVEAGASQNFSFGRGLTSENVYANRNTSQFQWNVGANLPLFQGLSAKRKLDYAKANLRAMIFERDATRDDVTLNVISAYLQVLYCAEIEDVSRVQRELSQVEVDRRRDLLAAGKIPELDLTEALSQLAQDEYTEVNAGNDRMLALVDLAQLLELDPVEKFEIMPVSEGSVSMLSVDEVYRNALMANSSVLAAKASIEVADRNILLAKTGYIPKLSFNAGLGSNYYTTSGIPHDPFGRQMHNNFATYLGFSLSVPIFDGLSTSNSVKRAKVDRLSAELRLDETCNNLYKAINQAYFKAEAARKRLAACEVSRDATYAAFQAMTEKYNFGRANATEFEQSKSAYIKALAEQVQAKYELLLRSRILEFYNRPVRVD